MIKRILTICLLTQAIACQNLPIVDNNILDIATPLKPLQAIIIGYLGFEKSAEDVNWPSVPNKDKFNDYVRAFLSQTKAAISPAGNEAAYVDGQSIDFSNLPDLSIKGSLVAWRTHPTGALCGEANFNYVTYSPDGIYVAASARPHYWLKDSVEEYRLNRDSVPDRIYIWDSRSRKLLKKLMIAGITNFIISEKKLICASLDGTIQIIDISNFDDCVTIAQSTHENVKYVSACPNGFYLFSHSSNAIIKIWDLKKLTLLQTLEPKMLECVLSVSPDSLYFQCISNHIKRTWKSQALEVARACKTQVMK